METSLEEFYVQNLQDDMKTLVSTVNVLNFRTSKMFDVITQKIQTKRSFHRENCRIGADEMANSVDPDLGLH